MVEFKQIVGRGTRLFDGKDYFTIYDFVEAYKHFKDETWDGPLEEPKESKSKGESKGCLECEQNPCVCYGDLEEKACDECNNIPCVCESEPKQMIRVKLSAHRFIELDSMVETLFYSPSGIPISAEEFSKNLFGDIPTLFGDENELRKIWSSPDTRRRLLGELDSKGYSEEQLDSLKCLIHAQDSDIYDVLAHIAYDSDVIPRKKRAERAKVHLINYNKPQREFLKFVLHQYVSLGVTELDDKKLPDLLTLKYNAISDAKSELGEIKSIRNTFIEFQPFLYEAIAA